MNTCDNCLEEYEPELFNPCDKCGEKNYCEDCYYFCNACDEFCCSSCCREALDGARYCDKCYLEYAA